MSEHDVSDDRELMMREIYAVSEQGIFSPSALPTVCRDKPGSSDHSKWCDSSYKKEVTSHRYLVFASPPFQPFADRLQRLFPTRFKHLMIDWSKFADGTDKITIGGFHPENLVSGEHCLFIASL